MPEQSSAQKVELINFELYSQYQNCDRWAAIVGIPKYQDSSLNLRHPDRDAEDLYKLLLTEKGMQGAADANDDGIVSVGELFEYVRHKVIAATNSRQHPVIGANGYDRDLPVAIALK